MKKLLLFLITSCMLLCGTVSAAEEVVVNFYGENTINKNITKVLPGTENSETEDTHFKLTNDNKIAYCSQGTLKNPEDEENAVWDNCNILNGKISKSLAYIYENGYGSYTENYKSSNYLVGNNKYTDYFITQVAVWNFMSPPDWFNNFNVNNHTYTGLSNDNTIKISNLIKDAEKAQEGASLSIIANNDMTLTLIDGYYVSSDIRILGTYLNSKINVKVSGQSGAIIVDKLGNTVSSVENNSVINVKIPVSNVVDKQKIEFNLSATATSAIGEGRIKECKYSGNKYEADTVQNIIIYTPNDENLSDDYDFSVNTINVKISKKDTNGGMLSGAKLTIKQGNNVIKTWSTGTESEMIALLPGNYTLVEDKTPNGYIINDTEIDFVVKSNAEILVNNKAVEEIVVFNYPIEITISKRKVKSHEELSGATLRITDINGEVAKDIFGNSLEWISSDEAKVFHVNAGTYILEEVKAPNGYELSSEKIQFTVNEDGTVTVEDGILVKKEEVIENNLIIFENVPEPEDVGTGSTVLYIAVFVGIVAISTAIFMYFKRNKK